MVCCYNNSFISGRLYTFELLSFIHFASYDRPYAIKIKYPATRGYQFLLDTVFACCCMKGLACLWHRHNEHNLDRFVGWFSCCILYISQFSFCLLYHSHPFCWWIRHNKEGHTRLVLTHPISGCLLHDKCFIFIWAGKQIRV